MPRLEFAILVLALTLALAVATAAQPVDTFVVNDHMSGPKAASIFHVDAHGKFLGTIATMPPSFEILSTTMATDNRSIRVVGRLYTSAPPSAAVLEVSPTGSIRTVYSGAGLRYPFHTYRNDDGDWIVIDYATYPTDTTRFVRLRGGNLSVVSQIPGHYVFSQAPDPATGRLITKSRVQYNPMLQAYCLTDVNAGKFTSIASCTTISTGHYGTKKLMIEPDTGGIVDVHRQWTTGGILMTRTTPSTGVVPLPSVNFGGIPRDMAWPGPRVTGFKWYLLAQYSKALTYDLMRIQKDGRMTTFHQIQSPFLYPITSLTRYGSRHLTWTMDAAPNDRSLHLSFPGEGGTRYAVGLSLTGIRPGVYLRDARVISLEPDWLTRLSLTGGIPGVIEGTAGQLDANGRGRVKIHLNRFGRALQGLSVWAVTLLLDSGSTLGIAHITPPEHLTIK